MNDEQIAAFKEKINKMIEALKLEWEAARSKGNSQYSRTLDGRIKGLEFSLITLKDVIDNG